MTKTYSNKAEIIEDMNSIITENIEAIVEARKGGAIVKTSILFIPWEGTIDEALDAKDVSQADRDVLFNTDKAKERLKQDLETKKLREVVKSVEEQLIKLEPILTAAGFTAKQQAEKISDLKSMYAAAIRAEIEERSKAQIAASDQSSAHLVQQLTPAADNTAQQNTISNTANPQQANTTTVMTAAVVAASSPPAQAASAKENVKPAVNAPQPTDTNVATSQATLAANNPQALPNEKDGPTPSAPLDPTEPMQAKAGSLEVLRKDYSTLTDAQLEEISKISSPDLKLAKAKELNDQNLAAIKLQNDREQAKRNEEAAELAKLQRELEQAEEEANRPPAPNNPQNGGAGMGEAGDKAMAFLGDFKDKLGDNPVLTGILGGFILSLFGIGGRGFGNIFQTALICGGIMWLGTAIFNREPGVGETIGRGIDKIGDVARDPRSFARDYENYFHGQRQ